MELDIHFKSKTSSIFFSFEKPTSLWGYSVQKTQDWNFEYVLVERTIREFSVLFFHVTIVTSYTTDKKWTDQYVSGLKELATNLTKNDERILKYVEENEGLIKDPEKRLKIISDGKIAIDKTEPVIPPVAIIEEFLQKENINLNESTTEQLAAVKSSSVKKKKPTRKRKK